MSSLLIFFISAFFFIIAYKFYGSYLERLFGVNPKRPTPAIEKFDSVDYIPAKNSLVLFGHHFSSIAGAGPIIGPVIAVSLWGWGPALVWILAGTVLIGGIHDFGTLVVSVRNSGNSISDIAESIISRRAKLIFSGFVWLALILVVSVFTFFCAQTFISEPRIVIPSLGLIPVAILTGFMMYNLKLNNVLVTAIGLLLLALLLVLGTFLPVKLTVNPVLIWSIVLLMYCFFASVMPVNILLQPRDYLSAYLLFFGVFSGYLGLLISHPKINAPFFISLSSKEGFLWPMLFVTVACGAVSGFHSLISSGTTSKQLANERHAKRIGYGAMVLEGFVAVMALLCVAGGLNGTNRLGWLLSKEGPGPVGAFGEGFGNVTSPILFGFGGFIAVTILNAFILTTLDTATRVARYVTHELFKIKNRYLATLIIVIAGGALTISGQGARIWAVFGASNQLVGALALFVLSVWLLSNGKNMYFTLLPAVFMLLTTIGALVYLVYKFFMMRDFLTTAISAVLIILSLYMVYEVLKKIFLKRVNVNV